MKIHQFNKQTLYLSVFALMFVGFVVNAQERLTIKDAINYALENKADARKARLSVQNSEHQIAEVRSRALPQINASGSLIYNPVLQEMAMRSEERRVGKECRSRWAADQ